VKAHPLAPQLATLVTPSAQCLVHDHNAGSAGLGRLPDHLLRRPLTLYTLVLIVGLSALIVLLIFTCRRCAALASGEVRMIPTRPVKSAQRQSVQGRLPVCPIGGRCFAWSLRKIRVASVVLACTAIPAAAGFTLSVPFAQWLCLAWLLGVAVLLGGLGRRASADTVVLSIDERGIFDRRLMSRHFEWREIEAIGPVNIDRSRVVDIRLRWPKATLAGTRWPVRIGAHCQTGYGVPAVTISLLLLEGNVAEVLEAVAHHRPDLLHHKP
jgi:MFS family permease